MTIELQDPLVEKLLAVVAGQPTSEVRAAVSRFRAIVDQYTPTRLGGNTDPFQIKVGF
jgi:hypothetical protein